MDSIDDYKITRESVVYFISYGRDVSHINEAAFNSLPNDKILDWSNLKAVADDTSNAAEKLKFVLGRVENIVGKGENAGHQHFSFLHTVLKRLLCWGR